MCCPLTYSTVSAAPWEGDCARRFAPYLLTDVRERFGRLLLTWPEIKPNGRRLVHNYAVCVDTRTWQFYFDCRPRKIFAKCFGQLLLRPLHAVAKTIYHLSMVPILMEIKRTCQRQHCWRAGVGNAVRSLIDCIWTPLYSTALIITSVAVLAMGLLVPSSLYRGRACLGALECMGNWGTKHTAWTLAPCFQPFPVTVLDAPKYGRHYANTEYPEGDELAVRLTNFARSLVHNKRKHRDLFDACMRLDENTAYVSSILEVAPEPLLFRLRHAPASAARMAQG